MELLLFLLLLLTRYEIILWDTLHSRTIYLFQCPGVRCFWEMACLVTVYSRSNVGFGAQLYDCLQPLIMFTLMTWNSSLDSCLQLCSPIFFDQTDALGCYWHINLKHIYYALKLFCFSSFLLVVPGPNTVSDLVWAHSKWVGEKEGRSEKQHSSPVLGLPGIYSNS